MDKKQLTELISLAFKSLTPIKLSVFVKNEDIICVRVVSDSFAGMTFSKRFTQLNDILKQQQTSLYSQYLFVFEAFTNAEQKTIGEHELNENNEADGTFKESAKEIEP